MMTSSRALGALVLSISVGACSGPSDERANAGDDDATVAPGTLTAAIGTYAEIVSANYEDSLAAAKDLDAAIDEFLNDPSESRLDAARQAWLDAREPYLQTEVYRFYGGPIDDEDGPEGLLNAWPLDEAYIDYVQGDDTAGLINSPDVALSAEALEDLNEQGGEANIATGYHAIEFLLWGQDFNDEGPGDRPYTDIVTSNDATADHQERRAQYLALTSELLVEHLAQVANEWATDEDNYRAEFEDAEPTESLAKILTGMIILSGFETGGERLQAALDSGDQEDEHSCFSDNTHRDMIGDIQGVLNVYLGTYERVDGTSLSGTGIRDVVEEFDPELAEQLENKIRESLHLAEDLETPFDQAIALDNDDGREGVSNLVQSLREQEGLLEDVFRGLSLEIPVAE